MFPYIPSFAKNFYFLFGFLFFIWMLFFDSNDFFNQYRMSKKLDELGNEKAYYEEKIMEVHKEREELFSNPRQLEKFARENYIMRRKSEDVFVIVEE